MCVLFFLSVNSFHVWGMDPKTGLNKKKEKYLSHKANTEDKLGIIVNLLIPPPTKENQLPAAAIRTQFEGILRTMNTKYEASCKDFYDVFRASLFGKHVWTPLVKAAFPMPDAIDPRAPLVGTEEDKDGNLNLEYLPITAENVVSVFEKQMWRELYDIEDIWKRFYYWVYTVDWVAVDDELEDRNVAFPAASSGNEMKNVKQLTECYDQYDVQTEFWMLRSLAARCNDIVRQHYERKDTLSKMIQEFRNENNEIGTLAQQEAELEDWFYRQWGLRFMHRDAAKQFAQVKSEFDASVHKLDGLLKDAEEPLPE